MFTLSKGFWLVGQFRSLVSCKFWHLIGQKKRLIPKLMVDKYYSSYKVISMHDESYHKFSMSLSIKALSYASKILETKIGNHFEQLTIINFIRLFPLPFPHFTSQTPTNIRFELPFYCFVCTITIRFYEHKGVKGCGRLQSNCGVAGPNSNAN